MIVNIEPIFIIGDWDKGFCLDKYVINSVHIGVDPYGHDRFENEYSKIGLLLHRLKYKNDYSGLDSIVDTAVDFIKSSFTEVIDSVETIIPVPPTRQRDFQPVFNIAEGIAQKLNVYYCEDVLKKTSNIESKSLSSLEKDALKNSIVRNKTANRKHSVLLIDDLLKTGSTLNECVQELRKDDNIDEIYVLSITKTKNS